jgi:acetyl-CoA carboxylase carboxyl transferase subunit beta
MDFQFLGNSMGFVVGEKITRLVEYATKNIMSLIIVCSSGGTCMQKRTLSLMRTVKISSILQIHQAQNNLLYIIILTYPTTCEIIDSFGMLRDITIVDPKAYIAFVGKRMIEQTLYQKIHDGFQVVEFLFNHGLLDLIIPRNLLKGVLSEIFELYGSSPYIRRECNHSFSG